MTTTMTHAASDLSISFTEIDMLFFFPETFHNANNNNTNNFATLLDVDIPMEDDEEEEEYSFLTRGVLQHRTVTIQHHPTMNDTTTDVVSEMSVGTDYLEYERIEDNDDVWTLRPIAQRARLAVFDPRICTIQISSHAIRIAIANNGVVEFYTYEGVMDFCAALTEYDPSWIFHIVILIRPLNGTTAMANHDTIVVTSSSLVEETLRSILLTSNP